MSGSNETDVLILAGADVPEWPANTTDGDKARFSINVSSDDGGNTIAEIDGFSEDGTAR